MRSCFPSPKGCRSSSPRMGEIPDLLCVFAPFRVGVVFLGGRVSAGPSLTASTQPGCPAGDAGVGLLTLLILRFIFVVERGHPCPHSALCLAKAGFHSNGCLI